MHLIAESLVRSVEIYGVRMKSKDIDKKFVSYKKIVRLKRICMIIVLFPPFIAIFIGFFISEEMFVLVIRIIWIPYLVGLLGSVFALMAVDCCPRCGRSFFCRQYGLISTAGLGLFSNNKCANCNEPIDMRQCLDQSTNSP